MDVAMAIILAFYLQGAHWRHLKNTTEPFMCGVDAAALCQVTLTTCFYILCMQVLHLESSNAAMAEDLLSKTAIIEHYVMETKSGISSMPYVLSVLPVTASVVCEPDLPRTLLCTMFEFC